MERSVNDSTGILDRIKRFFRRSNVIPNGIMPVETFSYEPLPFTDYSLFDELYGLRFLHYTEISCKYKTRNLSLGPVDRLKS